MDQPERSRRSLFDKVSETYEKVRPVYPEKLVDDLARNAEVSRGTKILEIGSGTGQLTSLLARRGFNVTALELGENLSCILKDKFKDNAGIRIVNDDFENYALSGEHFDVVVAATSFHWLKSRDRMDMISSALNKGGFLAIIETHHVDGGSVQFFEDSQNCYIRWDEETVEAFHLPQISDIKLKKWEPEASEFFGTVFSETYEMEIQYDSRTYCQLLATYSDVLAMKEGARTGLLKCIGTLIGSKYSGMISKKYLMELFVARKKK